MSTMRQRFHVTLDDVSYQVVTSIRDAAALEAEFFARDDDDDLEFKGDPAEYGKRLVYQAMLRTGQYDGDYDSWQDLLDNMVPVEDLLRDRPDPTRPAVGGTPRSPSPSPPASRTRSGSTTRRRSSPPSTSSSGSVPPGEA